MIYKPSGFVTERLIVDEWHLLSETDRGLAKSIMVILTPSATQSLPDGWRGEYSVDRAAQWIKERDKESTNLLVLDRPSKKPIGLMIMFESDEQQSGRSVRIGYVLAETAWGQGFATELLQGFIDWCRTVQISSIVGGVERDNVASQRVMEKNGFVVVPNTQGQEDLLYQFDL